jgi:CubicO group peptidase (beta-lactamase class C family)
LDGTVVRGFEPVRDAFADVLREQGGRGAAVAAWHDGRWVVDLWGGFADVAQARPWQQDTLCMPYSVSKPFAALPLLALVDAGQVSLDDPVQQTWPEFRTPVTLRQLLSHQAGIVALDDPAPTELFYDWSAMCERLARQRPLWEPGTARGESALFFGHLVGEPVRRTTGETPGRFLRRVVRPLGIDFSFGLDEAEQARAAELSGFGFFTATDGARANPPGAFDGSVVNGTQWRAAEIPAVNGHGTARALAGMFVALVTGRLLTPDLVAEVARPQVSGVDRVFGHDGAWGLGVAVDDDGWGMGGSGGSFAGWSAVGGYALGFVTSLMGTHDRVDRVDAALRECLGAPPL